MTPPMIVALFAMMAVDLTDAWFVAQLGEQALAALSFTFPVAMFAVSIGIGLMAGASAVIANAIGGGRTDDARRLTRDATLLALGTGLVLLAAGQLFGPQVLGVLGTTDTTTLALATDYLRVWLFSVPAVLMSMALNGGVRATGDTRGPSRVFILGALVNLVFAPLLIFGVGPFPRLEIVGAAASSVIARYVVLGCMVYLTAARHGLLARPHSADEFHGSWRAIGKVAVPATVTNLIAPVASGLLVAILARQGESAVAGYGAALRIESLSMIAFFALSAVIGPVVAQNLGARLPARAFEGIRVAIWTCVAVGVAVAAALWLTAPWIASAFSDERAVRDVITGFLRIVPASAGLAGVVMVVNAALNSGSRPLQAMCLSALRVLVLSVPLAWLLSAALGASGVFVSIAAANVVAGVVALRVAFTWRRRFVADLAAQPA